MSSSAKQPVYAAHCGKCDHRLYGKNGRAWCGNTHCSQCAVQFLVDDVRITMVPEPEKDVA